MNDDLCIEMEEGIERRQLIIEDQALRLVVIRTDRLVKSRLDLIAARVTQSRAVA